MIQFATLSLLVSSPALVSFAQTDAELQQGIAQWKAMLEEGNPADLNEVKGQELWKKPRGPKNVSLEQCELGKGPGVVKGAWAEMPRYFKDTNRVQDLESRLMTCMETLQGIDVQKEVVQQAFLKGERKNIADLVTYIAAASKGVPLNLPQSHPKEKEMYKIGKELFFYQSGPFDFSCASCHGETGKRIRASALPNLTENNPAGEAFSAWPAYRVSNSQLWTMQHRLNDCYRQQRFPEPIYGSDATIALGVYLGVTGKGVKSVAPGIKR
jgi:sulfur-oxidizing protein SoxA